MTAFDIIVINMSSYSEWQHGVSNRNYHVLSELAKSPAVGKIFAVDYPPLTFKRALRNYKENMLAPLRGGSIESWSLLDRVTKLADKLLVYSSCEFFIHPRHFVQKLKQRAVEAAIGDFVLWSYFPPIMPYLSGLGQKLTIFDAVDNWAEHSSYAQFKERLKHDYSVTKTNADVIFTVSEELQALFDNQPNVYWIPNGVDIAHYQSQPKLLNRDIADIPHPIIGYIGVMQDRVDVDLLMYLARKNPTKSFVIIGPIWNSEDEKKLTTLPNVHILGYKNYGDAPSYIQHFDVALIPHKRSAFITSTNPMKLYEYLACGKPVVATSGSGAELFSSVVYIAGRKEDFNRKVFMALEEDSEEKRQMRREAVKEHSWSSVVGQMLDIIQKKLVS